jgi:hypothetical protein
MNGGWVGSFISRHQTELIQTRGTAQEESRLQVKAVDKPLDRGKTLDKFLYAASQNVLEC